MCPPRAVDLPVARTVVDGDVLDGSRQGRGDRTKAALVAAALELFARDGVDETSVDDITSAAAVAKGTFYVHFERKTDVLLEHAAQTTVGMLPLDDEAVAPVALEHLADRLAAAMTAVPRAVAGRMVREIVGNRDAWLRVLGARPTMAAIIAPLVARGQTDATLRTDLTAQRLAHTLTILWLDAVIGWAERAEQRDLSVDMQRATTVFLHGALA